jgi:4,5-DOPA dioxygenase extradiol
VSHVPRGRRARLQLSIDETLPPAAHYDLARRLGPLRDEGVLIFGSGNVVHNLHTMSWGEHPVEPYDWAARFDRLVRTSLEQRAHGPLIDYEELGDDALLAVPTPEHYLPLLYVIAQQSGDDRVTFPVDGVDGGSISMLSVQVG